MILNLVDLIFIAAARTPHAEALVCGQERLTYAALATQVSRAASGFRKLGLKHGDRVAIFQDKKVSTVVAAFAVAAAGGTFIMLNPVLKPRQVMHVLSHSETDFLVTSADRALRVRDVLGDDRQKRLAALIVTDGSVQRDVVADRHIQWDDLIATGDVRAASSDVIDIDIATLFYTSGSTGLPKGVCTSHRNLIDGARSVAGYLNNTAEDRILCVLPLSFDAGFSQLTTAFLSGATAVLLNYIVPRDVADACVAERITGITAVPPLWMQICRVEWPRETAMTVRYFANTGGHMPLPLLNKLRALLPCAKPYLMYGLTESFRSTYLDPAEIDRHPNSIGKAIPNNRVHVLRQDGTPCNPGEIGELVHEGATVSLGYWRSPELNEARFRPGPLVANTGWAPMAVWSGDLVWKDEEGFLYFAGRNDEMIKTSGYRVSPTEIEDFALEFPGVHEAAAVGLPDPELGHLIVLAVACSEAVSVSALLAHCKAVLPAYQIPRRIMVLPQLPRNANGKFDRPLLRIMMTEQPEGVA